jgi:AcrR family transcriptional regulator
MARFTDAQKQDRRRQILDAALRRFSRYGFHNTSTADIAQDVGVAHGTIFLYFRTKDDLITALADDRREGETLINAIAEAEADPVAGLTLLLDLHARSLTDPQRADERRIAIQGWAEALCSETIKQRLVETGSLVTEEIARLIERGRRSGQFKADADPEGLARTLVALFRGLALQATWDDAYDAARIEASVVAMLRGALMPDAREDRAERQDPAP